MGSGGGPTLCTCGDTRTDIPPGRAGRLDGRGYLPCFHCQMAGPSHRTPQGLPSLTGSLWVTLPCAKQLTFSIWILTSTLRGKIPFSPLNYSPGGAGGWPSSYTGLACSGSGEGPDPPFLPPLPGGLDPSPGSGTVPWSNHFLLPHLHHLVSPHRPCSGQWENRIHAVTKGPNLAGYAVRACPLDPERTFYHLPCKAVAEMMRNKNALNICSSPSCPHCC